MTGAFVDPYASARVRLEDGTVLNGVEGLQVWMGLRAWRETTPIEEGSG
jgi:hypothetical protein